MSPPVRPLLTGEFDPLEAERWADERAHIAVTSGVEAPETETTTRQCVWLAVYVRTYSLDEACRVAGITRYAYQGWLRTDPLFRELRTLADAVIRENVAQEVRRRAIDGVEQGIYHRGELVATERRYSDAMLTLLAKRVDPVGWSGQPTAAGTGDVEAKQRAADILTRDPETLALLHSLAERLGLGSPSVVVDVEPTSGDVVTP